MQKIDSMKDITLCFNANIKLAAKGKRVSKITVRSDPDFLSFGGTIYNGTDWTITSITFKHDHQEIDLSDIARKYQNQGTKRPQERKWQQVDLSALAEKSKEDRRYFLDAIIMPLTVSSFSIIVIEQEGVLSKWIFEEATGYKD